MTFRQYVRHFLRSAFGIGCLAAGPAAGLLSVALGFRAPAAILSAFATSVALFVIGLLTGMGPRAAAIEAERGQKRQSGERIAAARLARDRLSAIRLKEPVVAKARDLVVLEAGLYLEAADSRGNHDPAANAALEESIALVDAWLREADETSSERRFGSADSHPFPEAAERVAAALRKKAALIVHGRDEVSGEPSGVDRVAAEEELK